MNELWCLSASEVARLAKTSKVSAREVAGSALDGSTPVTLSSTADLSRQTGWISSGNDAY